MQETTEEILHFFKNIVLKEFRSMDWYFCPNPNQLQLFDDSRFCRKHDSF